MLAGGPVWCRGGPSALNGCGAGARVGRGLGASQRRAAAALASSFGRGRIVAVGPDGDPRSPSVPARPIRYAGGRPTHKIGRPVGARRASPERSRSRRARGRTHRRVHLPTGLLQGRCGPGQPSVTRSDRPVLESWRDNETPRAPLIRPTACAAQRRSARIHRRCALRSHARNAPHSRWIAPRTHPTRPTDSSVISCTTRASRIRGPLRCQVSVLRIAQNSWEISHQAAVRAVGAGRRFLDVGSLARSLM